MFDFISTLPQWAVVAIVCAVLGGIAGGIGGLLEKSGLKWGRFLPIIAIAFSVSFAGEFVSQWLRTATLTPQRTSELIKQTNPGLYGFIETTFPNDYAVLTAQLTDLMKSGASSAQIGPRAAEAMAQIRRKYAPMVGLASDAEHAELVDQSIAFYQALQATDPMLCNAVAAQGPVALLNKPGMDQLKAMVEPQAVLLLQAAARAMTSPTQRPAPSDDDWGRLGEEMAVRGATQAQFDAVFAVDTTTPDLCSGLILLMQTLNAVDTAPIKSVRAQYLVDASAG